MEEYILQLAAAVKELKRKVAANTQQVTVVEKQKGPKGDKGDPGSPGAPGKPGKDGNDGKDGVDGEDGVGVADVSLSFDNSLEVTLTNGEKRYTEPLYIAGQGNTTFITESGSGGANLSSVNSNIIPDTNVTYDIGSADKRFKDIYLSGNSIYLGAATITANEEGGLTLPQGTAIEGGSPLDLDALPLATSAPVPTNIVVKQNGVWVKATFNQLITWIGVGVSYDYLKTEAGDQLITEDGLSLILEG